MTVNQGLTGRALGDAVIDHVLTFPETHDQQSLVSECGTTACIAGWTILLAEDRDVVTFAHDAWHGRGVIGPIRTASQLLGVAHAAFAQAVYYEQDRDEAIANFKHLLDETYSERAS